MINKKNLLGKTPNALGVKDAVHVAIVAVRAGAVIDPGERCKMNEHREAIPDYKGEGIADPFRKTKILCGEVFWLMLNQDAVPNVQHTWEHPTIDFSPPTRKVVLNTSIMEAAKLFGVTYKQIMDAANEVYLTGNAVKYPGTKDANDLDVINDDFDRYDFWSEWAAETGNEFQNNGTECCPEYDYPNYLFE